MELVPCSSPKSNPNNPSWSEMFRSASLRCPPDSLPPFPPRQPKFSPTAEPPKPSATDAGGSLVRDPHAQRAFCIAMAHAGLALSLLLVYGLYRLLHDFLRPLQWALLCSIPLRQLQDALITFWTPPLCLGLLPTLLTVPLALLRVSIATLANFYSVLLRRKLVPSSSTFGFSRLFRWLVSFLVFIITWKQLNTAALPLFALGFFLASPSASVVSKASKPGGAILIAGILKRLKTLVAIGLILGMIIKILANGIFCWLIIDPLRPLPASSTTSSAPPVGPSLLHPPSPAAGRPHLLLDPSPRPPPLGLLPTLLVVPLALLRAFAVTLAEFRAVLLRHKLVPSSSTFSFSRLLWLVSFWVFIITYEKLGAAALPLFALGFFFAGPTASIVHKARIVRYNFSFAKSGSAILTPASSNSSKPSSPLV